MGLDDDEFSFKDGDCLDEMNEQFMYPRVKD